MTSALLPPNATPLERALVDTLTQGIDSAYFDLRRLWDPDSCPVELLPWLAWALSVDEWDTNWSEQTKRDACRQSVNTHRYKGTVQALLDAFTLSGLESVTHQEWFEYSGTPYYFKVAVWVSQASMTQAEYQRTLRLINTAKNLRSWMEAFTVTMEEQGALNKTPVLVTGAITTVYPQ